MKRVTAHITEADHQAIALRIKETRRSAAAEMGLLISQALKLKNEKTSKH